MNNMIIAVDGPAGAGKSTIAKRVAAAMNIIYVDTGAMYRAIALYLIRKGIGADDNENIEKACPNIDVSIDYIDKEQQVILNGENVNSLIRTEEVGHMASASSVNPVVRIKLVELQRKLAQNSSVIMDGRDIGTYVFPNADIKIYLTASVEERARRRYEELKAKNIKCDIDAIKKDIEERDYRDSHREFAPLKQAEDAILIDTSKMTIDDVVERILELSNKRRDT